MNAFELECSKSAKYLGIYYKKLIVGAGFSSETSFVNKSGYDSYIVYKGMFYALELKSVIGNSFPFSNLKDHQIDGLKKVVEAGGKSLVLIKFVLENPIVFAINFNDYIKLLDMYSNLNCKSLDVDQLLKFSNIKKIPVLPRKRVVKNPLWDLSVLFSE